MKGGWQGNMLKSLVVSVLSENSEREPEKNLLIKRVENNPKDLVQELLLINEPEEIGGRVALAGFYYQFLVTIEYMIEVMKGTWDFVSMELHEDVIVGKDNLIRFIQVKTSAQTDLKTSETGIYSRSFKEEDGFKYRRPDSWLDKLLMKAKYFPNKEFQTQFELLTSFVVTPSKEANVTPYTKNYSYNLSVPEDDHLLRRLSEEFYDKHDNSLLTYESLCGEKLTELLSRFHIRKRLDLLQTREYVGFLLDELGKNIEPGVRVEVDNIQWLIGLLMEKCQKIGDNLILYLGSEEVEEIRQLIHDNAFAITGESVRKSETKEVINKVFDQMILDIKDIDLFIELERDIIGYKENMIEWIDGGGTIRDLVNRYLDCRPISSKYREITEHDQTRRLLELFNCALLLILINKDLLKVSTNHTSLLVKQISSQYLSFLSLSRGDTLNTAVDKIRQLLQEPEKCSDILLNPPSSIILNGSFAGNKGRIESVIICEEKPEVSGLPQSDSLKDMKIIMDFVPGGRLNDEFDNLFTFNTMEDLRTHLCEFWKELNE